MKKKLISLCLAFVMLFSLSITAQASVESLGEISTEEPVLSAERDIADRLEDMISHFYYDVPGQYTVGNAIAIYNADTDNIYYIIPIFRGQECVGLAEMSNDGNITLTDGTALYDNIVALDYPNSLLYMTGGVVYAEETDKAVEIYDSGFRVSSNEEFVGATFKEKTEKVATKAEGMAMPLVASAVVSQVEVVNVSARNELLRGAVPTIEVNDCPIINFVTQGNYNLCWAACVATIANYKKGLSLTAAAVATARGHNYASSSYTGGSATDVTEALATYGLSYSFTLTRIAWPQIKQNIQNRTPFIMYLYAPNPKYEYNDPDSEEPEFVAHEVVGYGYSCSYGDSEANETSRYIRVWEPHGGHYYLQDIASSYTFSFLSGTRWTWIGTIID